MSTNQKSREGVAHKAKTCFLYVRVSTKLPEEAYDLLGIKEFNRLETTEYVPDGNSRVEEDIVETVVLLEKNEK